MQDHNTASDGETIVTRPFDIQADIAASFTYASFQNAIPVIRSIAVVNNGSSSLEALQLSLTSNPPFLRPKIWNLDRILAGETLPLSDRKVELDAAYLSGLNEAERGVITLTLSSNGVSLTEQHLPVRLLARDEWGGVSDMAQLLPAFVMPNDPAVATLLRAAAEKLITHGHAPGMDGYQSHDPKRAFMLMAAIYSAITGMALHYAEPPASFESRGQKIRRPSTVSNDGLATCMDTSLLFAATLEAAGLHPVILLFQGHAAAGVWLTPRTLTNAIEPDAMEIRKAIASRELIVFETTGVTHRPPMTLDHARQALEQRLDKTQSFGFVAAIDIKRSRSGGITPLASHEPAKNTSPDEPYTGSAVPLPQAPGAENLPADIIEVKPTTPQGRIDRWQKKLLDLTLRNRLLNFPDSKKTIPFLCTDIAFLEDRLAAGGAIRLISLPEQNPLGERDAELYREVRGRDIHRGFAAEALSRDELSSTLDKKNLEARLIDLHRQVRNDMSEGGTNTLFLAVGFLRWKKKPEDERSYRAPLLLVPVKLERRSASSHFTLSFHEDEPRFNATLLQFLERDFDLKLPQFGGDLPNDENGIDVPRLLSLMRQAVRDVPGMEVVDETALSTFSFAKFLMWKDLTERTEALRRNRVVRHLIDTPDKAFDAGEPFRDERELDQCPPSEIISLLPADSSQIAASLAAAEGRDFVIIGPPGTGKSQTIANMIANCLATGKTVLFVAEKTAALDVVYRRLREHGLGDHCLELHSNKADRKRFLGQLRKSWESGARNASAWVEINAKLGLRRDQLNAYVAALHTPRRNGLTPFAAMGIALKSSDQHAPTLNWPDIDTHDASELRELAELAAEVGRVYQVLEKRPALRLLNIEDWSSSWQEQLTGKLHDLKQSAINLSVRLRAFAKAMGLPDHRDAAKIDLDRLNVFAGLLRDNAGTDLRIMFDPEFPQLRSAFTDLESAIQAYRIAEEGLSVPYARETVGDIPVDALEQVWRQGQSAFWPMRWFKQNDVRKRLQAYAGGAGVRPEGDLPKLRTMQLQGRSIESNRLAAKAVPFAGIETSLSAVDRHLSAAETLRQGVRQLNRTPEEAKSVVSVLRGALNSKNDQPLFDMATGYLTAYAAYTDAVRQFSRAAGLEVSDNLNLSALETTVRQADELLAARHLMRDWASWCVIRNRAANRGLGPLIDDLEAGLITPSETKATFQRAYARWWLPPALDANATLRDFRRFQHEHAIKDFRDIDDLVRAEAASRVISVLAHDLPGIQTVPRNSELGLLRHQMELQRPNRAIREMIGAMPQAFPKLAPCMLMSPLSIAQYLPADQALFDVVIFDEASQITTWDAVGAIARGRQTIIVGDPKQLPPTNFFGRNDDDGDGQIPDHEADLESILDEARASGIPVRDLRWHYRSRHESLIAFSNYHYYQNRLITFPSPVVDDRAVRLQSVKQGVYDRGKSRTNPIEARAVADEAVRYMRKWLTLAETIRPTLGIITFNSQQQSLISDLLDEACRAHPELEWFFSEDRTEPTIVKNLENVQGDERDVILFSITFWKDAGGKLTMDFGALNRDGGERRLNVAVTRARQELIVFSGFTADQIDAARTKAMGVNHLKVFLDFAERGPVALPAQDAGSVGGIDSPFEAAVIDRLEQKGWQTVPQVGVSGFRIDIGIRHPDKPGAYLAGVECDGATYHRAATARDRDKVREQVLRGLGWNILRVWSTDWWFDAAGATQRLHDALTQLLEDSRSEDTVPEAEETTHWDMGQETDIETQTTPYGGDVEALIPDTALRSLGQDLPFIPGGYRISDLSDLHPKPDRFYDFDYRHTLKAMIERVVETEAPIRIDILAQRISRAHGWLRTGNKIRERIDMHLQNVDRTPEVSGDFIWKQGSLSDLITYRPATDAASRRGIPEISIAELAGIILANRDTLEAPDVPLELARLIGVERLTAISRARLDEAIERAKQHLQL